MKRLKFVFIKSENIRCEKNTINRMKRQFTDWKKINETFLIKGLHPKYTKVFKN